MGVKQVLLKRLHDAGIKLIVVDGYVTSFNDMQEHFVDASRVAEHYGLNPKDVIKKPWHYEAAFNEIVLRPRNDADYNLLNRVQEFYFNKQRKDNEVQKETNRN